MSAVCKSNLTVDIRAAAMCPSGDAWFWTGLLDLCCFYLGAAVVFVQNPTNILLRETHHVVCLSVCFLRFLSQRRYLNTSELRVFRLYSPPLRQQELIFPSKLCSLVRTTAAVQQRSCVQSPKLHSSVSGGCNLLHPQEVINL